MLAGSLCAKTSAFPPGTPDGIEVVDDLDDLPQSVGGKTSHHMQEIALSLKHSAVPVPGLGRNSLF